MRRPRGADAASGWPYALLPLLAARVPRRNHRAVRSTARLCSLRMTASHTPSPKSPRRLLYRTTVPLRMTILHTPFPEPPRRLLFCLTVSPVGQTAALHSASETLKLSRFPVPLSEYIFQDQADHPSARLLSCNGKDVECGVPHSTSSRRRGDDLPRVLAV